MEGWLYCCGIGEERGDAKTILGVIIGGVIGVLGGLVTAIWASSSQERRERRARIHSWRADAYKDLIRFRRRVGAIIEMTMPILDEGRPAPAPPSEEDVDAVTAGILAFGSKEVRDANELLRLKQNRFFREVQFYQEDKARGVSPGEGDQIGRYRAIEQLRDEYRAMDKKLNDRITHELQ